MPIVDEGPKQEVHPPPLLSPIHAQLFSRSPIRENSTRVEHPRRIHQRSLPIHNAQSSLPVQLEPLLDGLSDLAGEFQLVLVDDASTDATLNCSTICSGFIRKLSSFGMRNSLGRRPASD